MVAYIMHNNDTSYTPSELFLCISQTDVEEPSDDEATTRSHIDILKAEYKKAKPDLSVIERKMKRTFAARWKMVNNPDLSLEDIISDFPALRERNFVSFNVIIILFLFILGECERLW